MSNFDDKTVEVETEVRTDRQRKRNFIFYIQYNFFCSNQTLIVSHMSGMLFDSGN